jgi:hypothetical protein
MEDTKEMDEIYAKSGHADLFKNVKYGDREIDEELKAKFEA